MEIEPKVRFEDTETAFSHKSDVQLRKANFIFSLVSHPFLSNLARGAARLGLAIRLPIKGLIRNTVFEHFVGGEAIEESEQTIRTLSGLHVGTILDYSVEGEKSERGFDATMEEILHTIRKATANPAIPFCVFKATGMADAGLLEKIHGKKTLSKAEEEAFLRVRFRVESICRKAFEADVPVLIDAEESWLQDPIDSLAYAMIAKYNRKKAIVFNTFQMYRSDMLKKVRDALHDAKQNGYFLGVKLVRGAYMEKERERAQNLGYPSPIHSTREATDAAFNEGLSFCLENKERVTLMCGSHNEHSNYYLTVLMEKHGMRNDDPRVWYAQLLGMGDHISFNLAKAGYNVAKYVPYGPVEAVMPYLFRRAQENTSVAGQSSRELVLIRREMRRRMGTKARRPAV